MNDTPIEGKEFFFDKVITEDMVEEYSRLTGDKNPLHLDKKFCSKTSFGEPIVHGMLAASLFSTLLYKYFPVKHNLYISQTLQFRRAIPVGRVVRVKGMITRISETGLATLTTTVECDDMIAISGEAVVKKYE